MRKRLQKRGILEKRDAQDLQDFAQTAVEFQFLLHDGHQHVHAHGNPDLRLDGVDRGPVERLDAKVLLDPLEEQFDLPAALVQLGDHECRQQEVVREEHETFVDVGGIVADPPQRVRIQRRGLGAGQNDGAVAAQPRGLVHGAIGSANIVQVAFAADDEEGQALREAVEPREVGVAAARM